jgi:hypothetical protein
LMRDVDGEDMMEMEIWRYGGCGGYGDMER